MSARTIRPFWEPVPYKNYLYLSSSLNLFTVIVIFLVRNVLPPVVPLLYGRPEGQTQLVPTLGLAIAPVVAMTVTLFNVFLALIIKNEFLQKTLLVSSFLISFLCTVTIFRIIFLVGLF